MGVMHRSNKQKGFSWFHFLLDLTRANVEPHYCSLFPSFIDEKYTQQEVNV